MAKGKNRSFFQKLRRMLSGRRRHSQSDKDPIENGVLPGDGDPRPLRSHYGAVEKGKGISRTEDDAELEAVGGMSHCSDCGIKQVVPDDAILRARPDSDSESEIIEKFPWSSEQSSLRIQDRYRAMEKRNQTSTTEATTGWEAGENPSDLSRSWKKARWEPSHELNDSSGPMAEAKARWEAFENLRPSGSSERGNQLVLDRRDTMPASDVAIKKVCFVGAGRVGGPAATVLAFYNPFISVTVVDKNPDLIRKWSSRHLPFQDERGLRYLVRIARDGIAPGVVWSYNDGGGVVMGQERGPNLVFSEDVRGGIIDADMIFICVETPAKKKGGKDGVQPDTRPLKKAVKEISNAGKNGVIVVVKSTVPVGMAERIKGMLLKARPGMSVEILSNPEFLSEGEAINDLQHPSRVLIGSATTFTGNAAASALGEIYNSWVSLGKIQYLSNSSAELAKLAANAMLAQKISSINAISAICEQTGADLSEVRLALGRDPRIGSRYFRAGIGFGGPCLQKDVFNLAHTAESHGMSEVSKYWMDIVRVNDYQCERFLQRVVSRLDDSLSDKKVTIFGWAFKKGTSDTRESRSIHILERLLNHSAKEIAIFDPRCHPSAVQEDVSSVIQSFPRRPDHLDSTVVAHANPYTAAQDADAILILTDWDEFRGPRLSQRESTDNDSVASSSTYSSVASSIPSLSLTSLNPDIFGRTRSNHIHVRSKRFCLKPDRACHPECCKDCRNSSKSLRRSNDSLKWKRIAKRMKSPRWVFDGRNVTNVGEMERLGFRIETIGMASKWSTEEGLDPSAQSSRVSGSINF